MPGWLRKSQNRLRELAEGVDADLVQANQKRFKTAFRLLGLAIVLGLVGEGLHLPEVLRTIVRCVTVVFAAVGLLMAKWAQQESAFLSRPDPEGPPKIFKE